MRSNAILKMTCIVGFCLALPLPAHAAAAPAKHPKTVLSAEQLLKPADFMAQELAYYNKLTDPAAKTAFIVTRSWERLCQEVIDHKLPALQLPDKPKAFTVKYLLADEPVVINRALAASIIAEACEGQPSSCQSKYRGVVEMTAAQLLTPSQLTTAELDYYNKLTDPHLANNFIKTRSYVRLCKQVIDHKMPADELPDEPLGFSSIYLRPGEKAVVNDAVRASVTAICTGKTKTCL